jgi:signal transduction histidine kinase
MSENNTIDFSTVLASSVHDMKNSLGMLINSLEGLLEEITPANEKQEIQFKTLQYEASRINSELIQLLTLYRMDNDFLPVRVDEDYIGDVIEDQVARNQMLIDSSKIELQIDCDQELPWYFDADLVGGVIHNVLVNCLRYTHSKILIRAHKENGYLRVSISDDGPGYPEDMLREPSGQKENASLREGETHLGLYFSEAIAGMHKSQDKVGSISLENNTVLTGGTFTLYLP